MTAAITAKSQYTSTYERARYRKFKPPFFLVRAISPARRVVNFISRAPEGRCFLAGQTFGQIFEGPKGDANLFLDADQPILPFGFEIGKIVKYAGLNSDQLDLILGKNLARLLRIEPKPSALKTMDITQI